MSDSARPHRRQPTRLPHPWDSLGKNTGVGSLLTRMTLWFIYLFFVVLNVFLIDLQYCVGFCHTLTWISHRYTYVPSLLNLLPTSRSVAPLYVVPKHWFELPESYSKFPLAILAMCMFPCYFLNSPWSFISILWSKADLRCLCRQVLSPWAKDHVDVLRIFQDSHQKGFWNMVLNSHWNRLQGEP